MQTIAPQDESLVEPVPVAQRQAAAAISGLAQTIQMLVKTATERGIVFTPSELMQVKMAAEHARAAWRALRHP
jgi:hypothetical protein